MIRYFEVLGLFDEVEYFGFMDTTTNKVIEFDGEQFFCGMADFWDICPMHWSPRLLPLIPARIRE